MGSGLELPKNTRQTASEIAADEIRKSIFSGELRPNMPVRQESLAKKLSMSRMPIRDALRVLEAEGLVSFKPKHGFTVARFGADEIMEVAHIRYRLESLALEKAIANFSSEEVSAATERLELLVRSKAGDRVQHRLFHTTLYAPCRMPRLLELVEHNLNLANRFLAFEGFVIDDAKELDDDQHAQLLNAVVTRNYRLADALLYTHIVVSAKALADQIAVS